MTNVIPLFPVKPRIPKILQICIELGDFCDLDNHEYSVWTIYTNGDAIKVWRGENVEAARSAAEEHYPGVPIEYRGVALA